MRIAGAERTAETAESNVEHCARTVEHLKRHVERLSLACQGLWELLRERSDLTEEDLERKILEIDGRDGCVDGKILQAVDCPACGRKTGWKRNLCVMCGAPIKSPYQFGG